MKILILAVVVGAIAGCGAPGHVRMADSSLYRPFAFVVANSNWADAVVYAVVNGVERRAGTVDSLASRMLKVPRSFLIRGQSFQLVARELATGRIHRSPMIAADEDGTVVWEIGKTASTSRLYRR